MRATLMWTVNDLLAYGMASGWSTARVMGCSVCMDDTRVFHLQHGRKVCYFDCHRQFLPEQRPYRMNKKAFMKNRVENKVAHPRLSGDQILDWVTDISPAVEMPLSLPEGYGTNHKWMKKSIFWDLSYWSTLPIRHNLDVMHIEKNVFDNIFNTVMDIKGKTKDNLNARRNLKSICNRPELELDEHRPNFMPKAAYTLSKEQKRGVCEWIKGLQFPDGYSSNLARCVDMMELRMHGMKSHDCHEFMQKLVLIAFREMLPEHVWSALTEVSLLFQSICSTTLDVHKLHELENIVAIILGNLEKLFPPRFFDSMEHLIIHLPYETCVGGPVQYRWMYLFERFLRELKKKVKNKAHVEASIVEAYIMEEIGLFTSQYFD
ncbi:UNVERIFIED_CONTAM: hypothetical protein Slati_1936600 [Sesamum latifolium]|uniref:DUF4218 domain-containing protein n=1 Tax=Sesamum latifolium TaxID=2727402 RepID=A0AAW2X1Z3_9LAMI